MSNQKTLGYYIYVSISLIALAAVVALPILAKRGVLDGEWVFFIAAAIILSWFLASLMIGKKQLAKMPALQACAVLTEKLQEDHRRRTSYFLIFELEDKNRKTFQVARDIYAAFSQNEKGLLKYKQVNPKEHYLSNRFIDFETKPERID